jgi:hypothetical protein
MPREMMFGMFMTEQGPIVENKMERRLLLRTLTAYCEDLREELIAARVRNELESERKVEIVPANGVIVGRQG